MHFIAVRLTGRYVCVVFVGRQTIDYFGPSMYSYIYYIRIYSFYSFQAHHKCSLMDLRCLFNDSQPMFGLPRNVVEICAKHLDWRSILSQGSLCKWNVKCKCLQSVHSLIGINHVPAWRSHCCQLYDCWFLSWWLTDTLTIVLVWSIWTFLAPAFGNY